MPWLHRTTREYVARASPATMAAREGGLFAGPDGNAVSTADWIYNPDLSAVAGWSPAYWTVTGDTVSLMDAQARAAVDAAALEAQRDSAAAQLDHAEDVLRAVVLVLRDELNNHADKINAILTAIDGAASLAALKTAVAAIPDYPQRTLAQLRASVRSKLGT